MNRPLVDEIFEAILSGDLDKLDNITIKLGSDHS